MITQTQFPFQALLKAGLSTGNIILIILAGLAVLAGGAYLIVKAIQKKKANNALVSF